VTRWLQVWISLAAAVASVDAAETNTTLSEILAERPLAELTQASDLIKREVRDADGKKVGQVHDVVINLGAGKILYTVVALETSSNAAKSLIAVPAKLLSSRENHLRLKTEKSNLASAPAFSAASALDPGFVSELNRRFGVDDAENSSAAGTNTATNFQLTKAVLKMRVLDSSGGPVGEVEDLALDWNSGRVPFVIISPAGLLKLASVYYPVPPGALKMKADGRTLALAMRGDQFAAAPQVHRGDWANLSDLQKAKQVYAFYGTPAYFESDTLQSTSRTNALKRIYHEPEK
jgi:sporulation protein YlmC with PRC-barrel domain